MDKLKVGIIGAGAIADCHIKSYINSGRSAVVAICDQNEKLAKLKADDFGIPHTYNDYMQLLQQKDIEAISICTPTFTHKQIVIDALNAGKHVLCEKPPALNANEVVEMDIAANATGKLLMFGFVLRFTQNMAFLKDYINSGEMGNIYYANVKRIVRSDYTKGWFRDKTKSGGGMLMDGAIHELDSVLYLMGYPKPVSVLGSISYVNVNLPQEIKGVTAGYVSQDASESPLTIESMARGFVTFENGASLLVEASRSLHTETQVSYDLIGEKSGVHAPTFGGDLEIKGCLNNYLMDYKPVLTAQTDMFAEEIQHFLDCCQLGTHCCCSAENAIADMKIIDAIYESARLGKPVQLI